MRGAKSELTRAGGKWTEARYWSFLRSALRRAFVRWPVNYDARNSSRRPYVGPSKQQKWEYECSICKGWFPMKGTQLDHVNPCGPLKSLSDLPGFVDRLFCEREGLRVLCKPCHQEVTNAARHLRTEGGGAQAIPEGNPEASPEAPPPKRPAKRRRVDVPKGPTLRSKEVRTE